MINQDKICCHYGDEKCKVLQTRATSNSNRVPQRCCGWDDACKFAKTEQQFTDDLDRSIFVCRQKGLCSDCKYKEVKCKLSMEA